MVYTDLGKLELAELQWRQATAEVPNYRPAWRGLGDILIRQSKYETVQVEVENMVKQPHLRSEGRLLKVELAKKRGDLEAVRRELDEATQEFDDDLELLRCRCRFLYETEELQDAQRALSKLVARDPDDAAAYHNLGTTYTRLEQFSMAVDAYRNSIRLRPNSSKCHFQLAQALQQLGKTAEARESWQEAMRLEPEKLEGYPVKLS